MNKRLSIIIPAYNEQERLHDSVNKTLKFIEMKISTPN